MAISGWAQTRGRRQPQPRLLGSVLTVQIVLLCHYLPPHEGGIERVVQRLASEYAAAGHEVAVAALGDARRADMPTGVRAVGLRGRNPLERFGVPVPIVEPTSTYRCIDRFARDGASFHVHGLPYLASMLALTAIGRRRARCVVTEHVGLLDYRNPVIDRVQRAALRAGATAARCGAQYVTVLNDRIASLVAPLVDPVPVVKVTNGVDTELFRPAADEHERSYLRAEFGLTRPTVVAVGRNVEKKGLRRVVEASRIAKVDAVLVGAGTSVLAGGHVRAHESLDQGTLARLYRAVDALVLPSEGEGLPLVVQEAMASGLPVVVGDDAAVLAELPDVGVGAVPASDVGRIADATAAAVSADSSLRHDCRRAAMRWSWQRSAARYLELLGA